MQVFKITGKFEQNGKWSELTGYFVKRDDDDVIEGYVDAQMDASTNPVRCIKGIYTKGGRLTFLQDEVNSPPICYDFTNVNKQDSQFTHYTRAYARTSLYSYSFKNFDNGLAQMQLEKIDSDDDEKMELAREIAALHYRNSQTDSATGIANRYLMETFKDVITVFIEEYCG